MSRKNTEQAFGPEPTFEEFETARKVIIFVRRMLAAERNGKGACRAGRDPLALADSPVMAEIVMRSSAVCNPALWEQTQLASGEGQYARSHYDAARAGE